MRAVPLQTLDDLVLSQRARLRSGRASACLLCGGVVRVRRSADGEHCECTSCGTEIAAIGFSASSRLRAA